MENYEACGSAKELLLIPNGVHASSFYEDTPLYQNYVRKLFRGTIGEQS